MSQRNPASVLLDLNGNPVGVVLDGTVYRLQVEATLTNAAGTSADIEQMGSREALAVSYPELLKVLERISAQLATIETHMAVITDEDDPL
jgi:ABC-type proline/glycine betaine transport system substrate-binding protein